MKLPTDVWSDLTNNILSERLCTCMYVRVHAATHILLSNQSHQSIFVATLKICCYCECVYLLLQWDRHSVPTLEWYIPTTSDEIHTLARTDTHTHTISLSWQQRWQETFDTNRPEGQSMRVPYCLKDLFHNVNLNISILHEKIRLVTTETNFLLL